MSNWRHYWRPNTGSLVTATAFAWAGIEPDEILVDEGRQREELTTTPHLGQAQSV